MRTYIIGYYEVNVIVAIPVNYFNATLIAFRLYVIKKSNNTI